MTTGYTSDANTIMNVLGMYPTGNPHTNADIEHKTTKYEFQELAPGEHMLNFGNPAGGLKLLIKFNP